MAAGAMMKAQQGVTLVELLIVVTIVGILAAVAIPGYRQYMIRTNRTEAKVALTDFAQDLERCMTRFNAYNDVGCDAFDDVRITEGGAYVVSVAAAPAATAATYTLQAVPQAGQVEDTRCATLTLTSTNVKATSGTDTALRCWNR